MKKSEKIDELAKSLCQFQASAVSIPETSENPYFKSKYADLDSIIKSTKVSLAANGLCISQTPETDGNGNAGITTLLMHISGQWIEATHYLKPLKQDPQQMGSCFTYARRYGYSAIIGISTDDDDDANKATHQPAEKPVKKTTPEKEFKPNPQPIETEIFEDKPENKRFILDHFTKIGLDTKDKEPMISVYQAMINKPMDEAEKILSEFCKEMEASKWSANV